MPELTPAIISPTSIAGLQALRDIARTLSAAWDLDTTLDLIARKTTEVMQVDSCSIYLLDADGRTLRLRASTGLARQVLGLATLEVGEGMTGSAVAENRPVLARDARRHPAFKWVTDTAEEGFQSLLAVPLLSEGLPIGALNVQTVTAHTFSQDEVEIVSLIGDLAAGALVKARLHDSQQRQIDELAALAEVSEVVTSPQYLDDILDVVTEMAAQMMEAAACAIYLLNEAGTHLELRSTRLAATSAQLPASCLLGQGVLGRVAADGRPSTVAGVRLQPLGADRAAAPDGDLVSLLAVPLSVGEKVIGVFCCYAGSAHAFTAEQEKVMLTLSNQTALAIEHARLATSAAMVREMHHRIKNNLQTVAMLMQLQLAETNNLDVRQVLQHSVHRIHTIAAVHETLSERGFHLVDVGEVLQRVIGSASGLAVPGRRVSLAVDGDAVLLPSRQATSLALVVNELVHNALEHGLAARKEGSVQVTLAHAPSMLVVSVRDDGAGLPADFRPGLGMEIVNTLVGEDLHGELIYRNGQKGTEVTIRMDYPKVAAGQDGA